MYFPGMKIDPLEIDIFACFFSYFFCHILSTIYENDQKHSFFSNSVFFAPLNDVHMYIASSWKTTPITWFFLQGWCPTSNSSAPTEGSSLTKSYYLHVFVYKVYTCMFISQFSLPTNIMLVSSMWSIPVLPTKHHVMITTYVVSQSARTFNIMCYTVLARSG